VVRDVNGDTKNPRIAPGVHQVVKPSEFLSTWQLLADLLSAVKRVNQIAIEVSSNVRVTA